MSESATNNNKICGRLCIEMTGRLASPLSVGSGEQEHTDADVIVNAQGTPYIPGSTLAGALREYANAVKGDAETNRLFGASESAVPGSGEDRQSRIFIYDAAIEQAETGVRDGVKLNERKTASHMGKYELQFVEQDAAVTFRIEILQRAERLEGTECLERSGHLEGTEKIKAIWKEDLQWIRLWVRGFNEGELRLGAKSRRGYGKIQIERVRVKKFDMTDKDAYMKWLDWDWDQGDTFAPLEWEEEQKEDSHENDVGRIESCLEVPLQIAGTLLVRTYNTAFARTADIPDYGQMTVGGKGEKATIPGSSWAGAFRSHIAKLVKEIGELENWEEAQQTLEPVFGTWINAQKPDTKKPGTGKNAPELCASRVVFEETVIAGGHALPTARIAVDRFTGGTVQGALYEETLWTGGTIRLRVRWKKDSGEPTDQAICGMLLWAIKDLQSGLLTVGGETAVGRGICRPQEGDAGILLDGEPLEEARQEACMQAAASWVQPKEEQDLKEEEQNRRQEDGTI